MTMYDPENPQHLDYLARAKAAARRRAEEAVTADRTTGMVEALKAAAIDRANKRRPWAQRVRSA